MLLNSNFEIVIDKSSAILGLAVDRRNGKKVEEMEKKKRNKNRKM